MFNQSIRNIPNDKPFSKMTNDELISHAKQMTGHIVMPNVWNELVKRLELLKEH